MKMLINNETKINEISLWSTSQVLTQLNTSVNGLDDLEVLQRQKTLGKNVIKKPNKFSTLKILLKQFVNMIAILLWVAGILAFVAQMPDLAVASWLVVIISGIFSFFQEYKANKELKLLTNLMPKNIKTIRNGKCVDISTEELVVGDIIKLERGNIIPADARLIETKDLLVINSMLTGEFTPVCRNHLPLKTAIQNVSDINNIVFAGATINQGTAIAVVYAIGNQTQIGEISTIATNMKQEKSTLELQITRVVKIITFLALLIALLGFGTVMLVSGMSWEVGFMFALAIIISNIPEGLLPTINLTLAIGAKKMAKENALVKKLSSIETLSGVTVLCTDKTGTLTQNKLTVKKIWSFDLDLDILQDEKIILNDNQKLLANKIFTVGTICNETFLNETNNFENGNSIDVALLKATNIFNAEIFECKEQFEILKTHSFSSESKKMSVMIKNLSNKYFDIDKNFSFKKGAPNIIINKCNYYYLNGNLTELKNNEKQQIMSKNDEFANDGYRVLSLSCKIDEITEIFLGLVAIFDPPRDEVKEAIMKCKKAGIKVTVITGDYGLTAVSIAKQIGIIENEFVNISGEELDSLEQFELENILKENKTMIFSRVNPKHKLRIVETYKRIGEIVAVTGDGVNDVLALKSAHIGIAMGKSGMDVARDVAEMILLDDNFATIVKAIEIGRNIYSNIKKFITYILTSNIPEIIPVLAMGFWGIPPALTVLQILAIDLGTDMFPGIALGAEKPEKNTLSCPPRKQTDKLINNVFTFLLFCWNN